MHFFITALVIAGPIAGSSAIPIFDDVINNVLDRPGVFRVAPPLTKQDQEVTRKLFKTSRRPASSRVHKPILFPTRTCMVDNENQDNADLKDSFFDDLYKPWGVATIPKPVNHVILGEVDDELFTPDSEMHEYDQHVQQSQATRIGSLSY